MNRKTLPIVLLCFFFPFVIYATGVKGGTHVTLPTFTTKPGASITATAVDGWSMKSAEVDNLDSWTIPSISGNNAATTYIPTSTSTFNVTMKGDLIPPSGEGDGPTDFSIQANFEGELYIDPSSLIIWHGDNAKMLTAKIESDSVAADWSIEATEKGNSWVGVTKKGFKSVNIGTNGDWSPPVGKYKVTATDPNDSQNKASAEIFVISLSLKSEDTELTSISEKNKRYSYIAAACAMPALRAKLIPASLPDDVEYSLRIGYTRSGRNDNDTYVEKKAASAEWNINLKMGSDIRGGQAVLTCKYNDVTKNTTFYIRGNNPSKSTVISYINSRTNLWYPRYVAIHESGSSSFSVMRQFNETGTFYSGNADVKYTPNASGDGGFGIFQLTNPTPSAQQLWSWHANCDEGISRLNAAQTYANNWMASQRRQMSDEGFSIPVPTITYNNVTFAENTIYIIEHAVALKRYNGASGGNFCAWDNANHCWKFNETNSLGFNYVSRICYEVQ